MSKRINRKNREREREHQVALATIDQHHNSQLIYIHKYIVIIDDDDDYYYYYWCGASNELIDMQQYEHNNDLNMIYIHKMYNDK